jgi:hypothetical protein
MSAHRNIGDAEVLLDIATPASSAMLLHAAWKVPRP